MSRGDFLIITNVIGFNLKSTVTQVIELDGTVKELRGGIRSTHIEGEPQPIQTKERDPRFFTNFNQALLDKIMDCRTFGELITDRNEVDRIKKSKLAIFNKK